eukprot:TRINITY_DN1005_c0_g1_i1.p1 TRINITY_DN1005_c0_g1~~TRINITY_DN1005_c0_g1_i1.p1  ORF type:complete len:618 (+),score=88.51 TRINITY_DN1005_c0_g1_i1:197-1855(+)
MDLFKDYELIDTVIGAREKDPMKFYSPENNPFRIQYAVYNLLDDTYLTRLVRAHKANVFVQIMVYYKQLLQPYVHTWQVFKDAGMHVADKYQTQTQLTKEQLTTFNLIGIDPCHYRNSSEPCKGLMHLKTRIYDWNDGGGARSWLVTGSANPEVTALTSNNEVLFSVGDPSLVETYRKIYVAIRDVTDGMYHNNDLVSGRGWNVLFSKAQGLSVREVMFEMLKNEREFIFLTMYALRMLRAPDDDSNTILKQLCAAKKRGAKVVVLTDKGQSDGEGGFSPGDPAHLAADLVKCGVIVYKCKNEHPGFTAFHVKNALLGASNMTVFSDSCDWTGAAVGYYGKSTPHNMETSLILDSTRSKTVPLRFLSNMLFLLRNYSHQQKCPYRQTNSSGSFEIRANCASEEPYHQPDWNMPDADEVFDDISSLSTWPVVNVRFSVDASCLSKPLTEPVTLTLAGKYGGRKIELSPVDRSGSKFWATKTPVPLPFGLDAKMKLSSAALHFEPMSAIIDTAFDWQLQQRRTDASLQSAELMVNLDPRYALVSTVEDDAALII